MLIIDMICHIPYIYIYIYMYLSGDAYRYTMIFLKTKERTAMSLSRNCYNDRWSSYIIADDLVTFCLPGIQAKAIGH